MISKINETVPLNDLPPGYLKVRKNLLLQTDDKYAASRRNLRMPPEYNDDQEQMEKSASVQAYNKY